MGSISEELAKKYGTPQKPDYSSVEAYKKSMEKAVEEGKQQADEYSSGENETSETDSIEQLEIEAKNIAKEIINELDQQESSKQETTPVIIVQDNSFDYAPIVYAGGGFLLGLLVSAIFFKIVLNKIIELVRK